jgi:hypothetical protein
MASGKILTPKILLQHDDFIGIVLFALLSRIVSRHILLPKMLSGLFFWIVMDPLVFVSLFCARGNTRKFPSLFCSMFLRSFLAMANSVVILSSNID